MAQPLTHDLWLYPSGQGQRSMSGWALSDKAILETMVPNWVKRVGGGDQPIIKVFNEKVGPRVGMHIELDGSVVKVPITKK